MNRATIAVYDAAVGTYETSREPRHRSAAADLASRCLAGRLCLDAGCGPGTYLGDLPAATAALDACVPMLRRARERSPTALAVCADLEALPFRGGALGAAWARNSYGSACK